MFKAASKVKFADIDAVKKRFLLLNKERLRRAEECMRPNQRDFLDFLPLLFHVNHSQLPGFISNTSPVGICDYIPSSRALTATKKYIHRYEYKKRAMPRYDIVSMFLMGSSGTVAYSRKSDFDIWLCHQSDLSAERLAELQAKATAIEEWADNQGLEVHFFLMDPESFKQGKIVDLSSESSGTAQYYLLLEEFYRTSLLLAGRYPAWWLVPVEEEANYDAYLKNIFKRRLIPEGECVDFGGIPTLPAEEFFGAALWQLFKGIDSPYKSVLKLLLMEVYASEHPDIELLCLGFKRSIYEGEIDLDRLDPYLMLYRRLEDYLLKRGEEDRLALVRRCFYFKVNQRLSQPDTSVYDWRRDVLRSMTNSWGWEQDYIKVMDDRSNWKIRQVLSERGVLVKELTYTYQFLSDFGRNYAQLAAINQQDLNALGRKLYAAFERKTGKVEIVNRGISNNVWESVLGFYQVQKEGRDSGWALLTENSTIADDGTMTSDMVPIKRGDHVIELVAWAYLNGLLDPTSVIKVFRKNGYLEPREVGEYVRDLEKILPRDKILGTSVEDLGHAVRILQSVIVVNLDRDPAHDNKRDGQHLASNRTDAFSYGGMYANLVTSFDQLIVTSWKEVIASHHDGIEGVLQCVSSYMQWMPPSKGVAPPLPRILCYSSNHQTTIQQRVEKLFSDLFECFYGSQEKQRNRYVFCVGRVFYILQLEGDALRYQCLSTYAELLRYLANGRQHFGQVVVDQYALKETLLPLMFKFNKPGVVQLFYRENGRNADVYVLDERGSLFYQEMPFFDGERLLGNFKKFFDAVIQRQLFRLAGQEGESSQEIKVEYYKVVRNRQGRYQVSQAEFETESSQKGYFNVQVIASQTGEQSSFTIYCDEHEFSSAEHGNQLFAEVASHVLKLRQSGQRYPIFITDIDLPQSMFADYAGNQAPTVDFLNYKKNIEVKLNNALNQLGADETVRPIKPR